MYKKVISRLYILLAGGSMVIVAAVSCDSVIPTTENKYKPVDVNLSVDHIPGYLETAVITCEYTVVVKPDWNPSGTWIVDGEYMAWRNNFEFVSGDSAWIDTVITQETRQHSIVVKAIRKGMVGLDGVVSAWAPDSIAGEVGRKYLWFLVR